jgi:hypothetical protein
MMQMVGPAAFDPKPAFDYGRFRAFQIAEIGQVPVAIGYEDLPVGLSLSLGSPEAGLGLAPESGQ